MIQDTFFYDIQIMIIDHGSTFERKEESMLNIFVFIETIVWLL